MLTSIKAPEKQLWIRLKIGGNGTSNVGKSELHLQLWPFFYCWRVRSHVWWRIINLWGHIWNIWVFLLEADLLLGENKEDLYADAATRGWF